MVKRMTNKKKTASSTRTELINEMRLTMQSLSVNEGFSRAVVGAFLAQLDPTALEISDLKCALSEAVTNCIVHAYPNGIGRISLKVSLYSDRSVKIEVKDNGVGIPDVFAAREPLFTTNTDGERSGMGFIVMESFCDRVGVSSAPEHGTTVRLYKKLSPKQKYAKA